MDVFAAVTRRRSIRRFKDRPVPDEALEKCVDAARLAPSGRNQQVCEYVVINDPAVLPGIFENIGGSVRLPPEKGGPAPSQTPGAYIIILINRKLEETPNRRHVSLIDVGLAAENIMLTALELGLGSCPILMFNEENLKLLLGIPAEYDVALVIAMGYPDESPVVEPAKGAVNIWVDEKGIRHVPKRRLEDIIHRNRFSAD
ncbi:MAG: nitroreductase family protein [Dehalococcoidales bacterium]|nr:nitroreductase family protein [Dehalococcoidales bacterium]